MAGQYKGLVAGALATGNTNKGLMINVNGKPKCVAVVQKALPNGSQGWGVEFVCAASCYGIPGFVPPARPSKKCKTVDQAGAAGSGARMPAGVQVAPASAQLTI